MWSSFNFWKGTHSIFSHTHQTFLMQHADVSSYLFSWKSLSCCPHKTLHFFLNHSRIKIGSFTWLACHSVAKYFLLYQHHVTYTISPYLWAYLYLFQFPLYFILFLFYSVAQYRWCNKIWICIIHFSERKHQICSFDL